MRFNEILKFLKIKIYQILFMVGFKDLRTAEVVLIRIMDSLIGKYSAKESLRFLFRLDNHCYELCGREAIRYDGGLHTKHRHIKYHDFFCQNINDGEKVLDIGCGNGFMDSRIIDEKEDVWIVGMDCDERSIDFADQNYGNERLSFRVGDGLNDRVMGSFGVIILSNILEHIEDRVDFLRKIVKWYDPGKVLIRVPSFERDWRVPLREEIGVDYRLDETHYIEYRLEEFLDEVKEGGLEVKSYELRWGEIWSVNVPN